MIMIKQRIIKVIKKINLDDHLNKNKEIKDYLKKYKQFYEN